MSNKPQLNTQDFNSVIDRIDNLIAAVLDNKITPKISFDLSLWSTSEIAAYLNISYKYTSEYVVTHHTFPAPIRLPNKNGKKGHPRWYAGEVLEWISKHREL